MKALFEFFNETLVFDGLTERVRAYMRTYDLDLDDIAVLLHSEPQHIADWLMGAAPRPQSVHTLLFSLGTPPNARGTHEAGVTCNFDGALASKGLSKYARSMQAGARLSRRKAPNNNR